MPAIFETKPGVVVAMPDPLDQPIPMTIDGWGGFFGFKSIITQLGVERQGNFQLLHTLQDLIYAYVFGERFGQLMITGLSFTEYCQGSAFAGGRTGIEHVLNYYDQNAISRRPSPLSVQIGPTSVGLFQGFMTGVRAEIFRPEARLTQFAFQFHTFPRSTRRQNNADAANGEFVGDVPATDDDPILVA